MFRVFRVFPVFWSWRCKARRHPCRFRGKGQYGGALVHEEDSCTAGRPQNPSILGRRLVQQDRQQAAQTLQGRNIVVTGGAGGLGLGAALRLAALGADIVIADINEAAAAGALDRLREAGRGQAQARFLRLNLAEPADVQRAAGELLAQGRPIDVLVNNAGIYPPSQRTLSDEGLELTLAIAHFGHFRLTHALWPLLQAAPAARVVTVSSLVQRRAKLDPDDLALQSGYTPIGAYAQAKLANLLFALELQRRLDAAGSAVGSYAAHPGVTRSGLGRNRRLGSDDRWYQRLSSSIFAYWQSRSGQSPEQGAEPLLLAAISLAFAPGSFLGPTGLLEMSGKVGLVQPGPFARDAQLAQRLWQRTEAITGLRWPC